MEPTVQTVYYALLALATLVSIGIGVVAIRNRTVAGAPVLAFLAVAMCVWLVGDFLTVYASSRTVTVRSAQLSWFGTVIVPTAVFVFALVYTGHERYVTAPVLAGLSVVPTITYLLVLTNGAHGRIWPTVEPAPETLIGFEFAHGPAFVAYTAYAYALVALTTVLLLGFLVRSRSIYRGQAAALVLAIAAPWLGNAVYVSGLLAKDLTPISFTVTTAALGVAIVRYRFADVVPVARDTVVDNITDAVFVLDREDRVADVNPGGRRLVDSGSDGSVVGRHAADVFPDPLVERYESVFQRSDEVAIETDRGTRHLAVDVTPLEDRRDRPIGRLFVVRDVTERRHRERELERQNEQLERFASVVSHDLRNPLNVADGYLDLLAERTDDPAVDEIETSLGRMERIVEDVLTLARQGQSITDRESVALDDLVTAAWNNVATADASLAVDVEREVQADPSRLTQALENLFRNAVEHGGEDVAVEVGSLEGESNDGRSVGGPIGFYVADDGPGIPAARREAVLEAGYTTAPDGTGLGLDIVKSIVEAHGWTFAVTESADGGARFEIRYENAWKLSVER